MFDQQMLDSLAKALEHLTRDCMFDSRLGLSLSSKRFTVKLHKLQVNLIFIWLQEQFSEFAIKLEEQKFIIKITKLQVTFIMGFDSPNSIPELQKNISEFVIKLE